MQDPRFHRLSAYTLRLASSRGRERDGYQIVNIGVLVSSVYFANIVKAITAEKTTYLVPN
jgi:hypothetical protein